MTKPLFDRTGVRYEVAVDILGAIIAHYTEIVATERAKPTRDESVMATALQRKGELRALRDDLPPGDAGAIERVIAEYGPQARALFGDEPAQG